MTKKPTTLFMLLVLCLSTSTFIACGDDDDDSHNNNSASFDINLLYGYWDGRTVSNGVNAGIYFGTNGKGYEDEGSGSNYDRWNITYSVRSNKITVIDEDELDDPYYTVYSITSAKLVLIDEYGDNWVLLKD